MKIRYRYLPEVNTTQIVTETRLGNATFFVDGCYENVSMITLPMLQTFEEVSKSVVQAACEDTGRYTIMKKQS